MASYGGQAADGLRAKKLKKVSKNIDGGKPEP